MNLNIPDADKNIHQQKVREIIVNGRPLTWSEKTISFQQVVEIAYVNYQDNGITAYTVIFKNGEGNKPEGSIVAGDVIHVKDKMIFNVTATNRS